MIMNFHFELTLTGELFLWIKNFILKKLIHLKVEGGAINWCGDLGGGMGSKKIENHCSQICTCWNCCPLVSMPHTKSRVYCTLKIVRLKGAVKWNCFASSNCLTMLQNHALMGLFHIYEHFPAKSKGFYLYWKKKNFSPEATTTCAHVT